MVQRCHTRHPERAKWVEEFMHGPVLSEVQARVFLDVSEPMDRVRCANDVNCLWDRDRPLIYDWLRSGFSIPNSKSSSAGG
jgi:hypothetical protein